MKSADIAFDDQIRAEVSATRPDRTLAVDQIGARANRLRRRTRARVAGSVAALVLCGMGVASALPASGGKPSSLRVESPAPHGHDRRPARTPRTTAPHAGSPQTTVVENPITQTTVGTVPSIVPGGTTPTTHATAPNGSVPPATSPAITSPPATVGEPTTPPTTVAPSYPPVAPGDVRLLVVLDGSGLHAPGTFPAGDNIEVLFDDQTGYPYKCLSGNSSTTGFLYACAWHQEQRSIRATRIYPGTMTLSVTGSSEHATIIFTK